MNIDFEKNPVTHIPDYREKLFQMFANLEILDGYDKSGEEVISEGSDDEDDDFMGEEGEEEYDDESENNLFAQLTEEQKAQMEAQGINIKEYLEGAGDDEFDESAEDELDDDEDNYGDEEGSDDEEDSDEGPKKRAKTQ